MRRTPSLRSLNEGKGNKVIELEAELANEKRRCREIRTNLQSDLEQERMLRQHAE